MLDAPTDALDGFVVAHPRAQVGGKIAREARQDDRFITEIAELLRDGRQPKRVYLSPPRSAPDMISHGACDGVPIVGKSDSDCWVQPMDRAPRS